MNPQRKRKEAQILTQWLIKDCLATDCGTFRKDWFEFIKSEDVQSMSEYLYEWSRLFQMHCVNKM